MAIVTQMASGGSYWNETPGFTPSGNPSLPSISDLSIVSVSNTHITLRVTVYSIGSGTPNNATWAHNILPLIFVPPTVGTKEHTFALGVGSTTNIFFNISSYYNGNVGEHWTNRLQIQARDPAAPSVMTLAATNVRARTVTLNANISAAGDGSIRRRVIDLSLNSNMASAARYELGAGSAGNFSHNVSGLLPRTTYYYRAYAENQAGVNNVSAGAWAGNVVSFTTTGIGLFNFHG